MNTETKTQRKLAITLNPVESSQIKAIGYSPEHKTVAIVFNHGKGAEYHYPNVSQEEFDALQGAESIGSHFGKTLKGRTDFIKHHPHKV